MTKFNAGIFAVSMLLVSAAAFAQGPAAAAGSYASGNGAHPCKKIEAACEAAGFARGAHKNGSKGLFMDCIKPLMAGQPVAGVTVDASDVQACQARKAKHKTEHK